MELQDVIYRLEELFFELKEKETNEKDIVAFFKEEIISNFSLEKKSKKNKKKTRNSLLKILIEMRDYQNLLFFLLENIKKENYSFLNFSNSIKLISEAELYTKKIAEAFYWFKMNFSILLKENVFHFHPDDKGFIVKLQREIIVKKLDDPTFWEKTLKRWNELFFLRSKELFLKSLDEEWQHCKNYFENKKNKRFELKLSRFAKSQFLSFYWKKLAFLKRKWKKELELENCILDDLKKQESFLESFRNNLLKYQEEERSSKIENKKKEEENRKIIDSIRKIEATKEKEENIICEQIIERKELPGIKPKDREEMSMLYSVCLIWLKRNCFFSTIIASNLKEDYESSNFELELSLDFLKLRDLRKKKHFVINKLEKSFKNENCKNDYLTKIKKNYELNKKSILRWSTRVEEIFKLQKKYIETNNKISCFSGLLTSNYWLTEEFQEDLYRLIIARDYEKLSDLIYSTWKKENIFFTQEKEKTNFLYFLDEEMRYWECAYCFQLRRNNINHEKTKKTRGEWCCCLTENSQLEKEKNREFFNKFEDLLEKLRKEKKSSNFLDDFNKIERTEDEEENGSSPISFFDSYRHQEAEHLEKEEEAGCFSEQNEEITSLLEDENLLKNIPEPGFFLGTNLTNKDKNILDNSNNRIIFVIILIVLLGVGVIFFLYLYLYFFKKASKKYR